MGRQLRAIFQVELEASVTADAEEAMRRLADAKVGTRRI